MIVLPETTKTATVLNVHGDNGVWKKQKSRITSYNVCYTKLLRSEIFLLLAYGKKEKADLSAKEVKILRVLVEENM